MEKFAKIKRQGIMRNTEQEFQMGSVWLTAINLRHRTAHSTLTRELLVQSGHS